MKKYLAKFDQTIITFSQKIFPIFSRLALFTVYFWFGLLKVIGYSPAGPLVGELLDKTLPFLTPDQFIFYFGLLEMFIGILFLIPQLSRLVIAILVLHLITTAGPLFLLPQIAWQHTSKTYQHNRQNIPC
jgi:uncharacterized membrane protein YkgB